MIGFLRKRVSAHEIVSFTSHLAEFIHAGVPLLKALELLEKESAHPYFQEVLRDTARRVRQGESFSAALKNYPALFSPFYQNLIQAGEMSGKLEEVLGRLASALEKEIDLRAKVGLALVYPSLVFAFGVFTIVFLMIIIVPKISVIYTDFGGEFPWITKMVLAASRWTFRFGWIFLAAVGGFAIYAGTGQKNPALRKAIARFGLSLPWIKKLILQAEMARFGRTLGMLIESGIPLLDAIKLATQTLLNDKIRGQIEGIERIISQGKGFSDTLRQRRVFPELALNLIWVGESTGNLGNSLQKLGEIAEKEVDRQVKVITTLLEPLIIIVVGLIVGVVVVSLLLPIFQMSLLVR